MTTHCNLEFTLGETWEIQLNCADGAGQPLLPSDVIFKISGPATLEVSAGAGDFPIESAAAYIEITPRQQQAAEIISGLYSYQARAKTSDGGVSDQAYGSLYIRSSLI